MREQRYLSVLSLSELFLMNSRRLLPFKQPNPTVLGRNKQAFGNTIENPNYIFLLTNTIT